MPQDVGATGQGRVAGKVGGGGWIASMAGRPLAHGFDGFRVGPRACGTWSHSGLLSGVWPERAPAVSSPGWSASQLTPAKTREALRQHKPRGQCGLACGVGHPIGLLARRMPRSTKGKGRWWTPPSCRVAKSNRRGHRHARVRAARRIKGPRVHQDALYTVYPLVICDNVAKHIGILRPLCTKRNMPDATRKFLEKGAVAQ